MGFVQTVDSMQNSQITECNSCVTMKCLLSKLDDKIFKMIKNKHNQDAFAATLAFDDDLYSILLRYKRILEKRVYNSSYPSKKFDNQDIISKVTLYLYK